MADETKVTTNTAGNILTGTGLVPNTIAIGTGTTVPSTFAVGTPADNSNSNSVDYDKLASILDGRMKATEESVLKGYFKEQGLSGEEMAQAIDMFKKDKASKTPDISALNAQIAEANQRALNAELELKATSIANELGVSNAKVPYLLKMADTSKATKDGKIDKTKLKESLEAVLNDVPELKSITAQDNNQGSFKIGASGNDTNNNPDTLNAQLATAFGVKLK